MAKRLRRKGATVTFSVSVDRETKRILRDLADRSYQGNVSELITQVAHQAARQEAAADLLRLHGRGPMTDEQADAFEAEIQAQLSRRRTQKRHRHRAA
jgi:hypothetical protein